MDKKTYALIDDRGEIHDVRMMDEGEFERQAEIAFYAGDGTFSWNEFDVWYGRLGKNLLKDLHAALFDTVHQPYRIPCDCPPAEPIYDERKNVIGAKPAFSCVYCRLTRVVDRIYEQEAKDANLVRNGQ